MLVLSRRPQQSLLIGPDVVVTVLEVNGDTVRIGITAPPEVDIHREEVYLDLKKSNADAAAAPGAAAALTRRMRSRSRGEGRPDATPDATPGPAAAAQTRQAPAQPRDVPPDAPTAPGPQTSAAPGPEPSTERSARS